MQLIMSLIGMVVLILVAVLLSSHRKSIRLRTVLGAFLLQVSIGALVLYVPLGRSLLASMTEGVASIISFGNQGVSFLFGGLTSDKMFELFGGEDLSLHSGYCRLSFFYLH